MVLWLAELLCGWLLLTVVCFGVGLVLFASIRVDFCGWSGFRFCDLGLSLTVCWTGFVWRVVWLFVCCRLVWGIVS